MEKSDLPEVARKRANKAASVAAEPVERRGGAKKECGAAKHGLDAEPGSRVTRVDPYTRLAAGIASREFMNQMARELPQARLFTGAHRSTP
jgi:hypothetical protein